jgi:hypothetical protein
LSSLAIPKDDREGLATLREMPESAFSSFLLAIETNPRSVPTVQGVDPDEAAQARESLDTMYGIRAYHDVPFEQFIDDVCEFLREHKELDDRTEPQFRDRLSRLLNIDALIVAAKATVLRQENERNFCRVRIMTDARPVYANGPSEPPAAMVITHMMKLSYHEGAGGHLSDFYIAFGTEELAEIRDALNRAEEKAKSLRNTFASAHVKFLDSGE